MESRCYKCNEKIKLGEVYGDDWCINCINNNADLYPSYVNIYTPAPSVYKYMLQDMKFVFMEELDSPEMRG